MKKVAFITPTYPALSETFIQTEVDSIQACGHQVCVFTFEKEHSDNEFNYDVVTIGENVPMRMLRRTSLLGGFKALHFVTNQNGLPKKSLYYYGAKLALQLAEKGVDHVHAHFCQHTAAHAIVAAKILNIGCSFVGHGHDVYESPLDIDRKIETSDFVVAVCKDMQRDFDSMAKGNIKLLHCGVKTERFVMQEKSPTEHVRLVFLGRLVVTKGVHYLINALLPLIHHYNISLDIIGDGEMREELESQVNRLGLDYYVRFLGPQPHHWVKDHLAEYDCLVAPFCFSDTGCVDTGPLVLKEAMAVGTPVICSDIMGCKEIVTSETGYLVPEKNVAELSQKISEFAQLSFEERAQMGRAARDRVLRHFNAIDQAKQLSNWIENLA